MREHVKKHDLRDEIYQPKATVTPMRGDPLADDEKPRAKDSGAPLATPDKGAVEGQTTHM